jgi:hypothetical protein
VEEQDYPKNHRPEVEGMDTVEEQDYPMNHRLKVDGMDMEDSGTGEDMTVELEVIERGPESMVLTRHQ